MVITLKIEDNIGNTHEYSIFPCDRSADNIKLAARDYGVKLSEDDIEIIKKFKPYGCKVIYPDGGELMMFCINESQLIASILDIHLAETDNEDKIGE